MKNFFLGIVATILAGIALLVAQDYYNDYKKNGQSSIDYVKYKPTLTLKKSDTQPWFKDRSGKESDFYSQVLVSLVKIKNTGREPLTGQIVKIIPNSSEKIDPGILGYENSSDPGGDPNAVRAEIQDGELTLRYDLLDAGEEHMFWITYDRFTEPKIVIRRSNLKVNGWDRGVDVGDGNGEESNTISWLIWGAAALVILFLGAVLDSVSTSKALKNRGYDLEAILKEPVKEADEN